eukprot:gene7874-8686_t
MGKINSNSSTNPDRKAEKGGMRSKSKIMRLNMYKDGKPIRNAEGKIIGGAYCSRTTAGGQKIVPGQQGRIAPDRRWFGNTRVISQNELDQFREKVTAAKSDPYAVLLRRKKIPMALLKDAADAQKAQEEGLVNVAATAEGFQDAFGQKSRRKRPKTSLSSYEDLMQHVASTQEKAEAVEAEAVQEEEEGRDKRKNIRDDLFAKGQSKRIWGELYKVLDCSDVVIQIIDARNVPGTRCYHVEKYLKSQAGHKQLVNVVNKVDLVPSWAARKWVALLSKETPTLAFHAGHNNKSFGKGALITLLRQLSRLHGTSKRQISVGIIGYPNVGKSSVINALTGSRSCATAPIPGQTKVWQYVALTQKIHLIDSPGIVYDGEEQEEEDTVLKGVVRADRLKAPIDFIPAVLKRVQTKHLNAHYGVNYEGFKPSGEANKDLEEAQRFLSLLALKQGKLLAGGEPDIIALSKTVINDFQRGKLPFFVAPPRDDEAAEEEVEEEPLMLENEEGDEEDEGEEEEGEQSDEIDESDHNENDDDDDEEEGEEEAV